MVTAVSGTRTAPSGVQVKFDLRERPQVASPLDIDLVIVPLAGNVDRVSGKVDAGEGHRVADGAPVPPAGAPPEGTALPPPPRRLPKRGGTSTLAAPRAVGAP